MEDLEQGTDLTQVITRYVTLSPQQTLTTAPSAKLNNGRKLSNVDFYVPGHPSNGPSDRFTVTFVSLSLLPCFYTIKEDTGPVRITVYYRVAGSETRTTDVEYLLPPGNYTNFESLVDALNASAVNQIFSDDNIPICYIRFTYNTTNGKIETYAITHPNLTGFSFVFDTKTTMADYLGYFEENVSEAIDILGSYIDPDLKDLDDEWSVWVVFADEIAFVGGVQRILIKSPYIVSGNWDYKTGIRYLADIPIINPDLVSYQYSAPLNEIEHEVYSLPELNHLRIEMLDQDGNHLDFNGVPWTMVLRYTYYFDYYVSRPKVSEYIAFLREQQSEE